jgi:hypothetical protein
VRPKPSRARAGESAARRSSNVIGASAHTPCALSTLRHDSGRVLRQLHMSPPTAHAACQIRLVAAVVHHDGLLKFSRAIVVQARIRPAQVVEQHIGQVTTPVGIVAHNGPDATSVVLVEFMIVNPARRGTEGSRELPCTITP